MSTRKGLGRGIDSLLSKPVAAVATSKNKLPVDVLQKGRYQPRRVMDKAALEELAASIKTQGILQPVVVRRLPMPGKYEIVAGERRWRAAQMAGLRDVPVNIVELSDSDAMAVALIENIQRRDLSAVEEARALKRLAEESDLTHEQVAEAIGRSRSAVTNLLRVLELNGSALSLLEQGKIELGHAKAILALPELKQARVAAEVAKSKLSVRATEALVKKHLAGNRPTKAIARVDPNIQRLEQKISETLAAPVSIAHKSNGKGQVTIRYTSLEELEGLLERIA